MDNGTHSVAGPWLQKVRTATFNIILLAIMLAVGFIVLEGLSSAILFISQFPTPPTERRYTKYDALLGWAYIPNLMIPDMYGPGIFLRTNSQGFRGSRSISTTVPDGKVRAICSGDSFTQGHGVDDDHTWCQQLATLSPRLETVNMGQAGYGIDQAYLWYQRDGNALDHDIHIFAFITLDIFRMEHSDFHGYGKPVLNLDRGHLLVKNVPVPRQAWYVPWTPLAYRLLTAVRELKSYKLAVLALGRHRFSGGAGENDAIFHDHTWNVALKVFESLQMLNQRKKSALVLVYLPERWDYDSKDSENWRRHLAIESRKKGWLYVDLISGLRQLPRDRLDGLFLADGHYNVAGNKWVAQELYQRISALPQFSRKPDVRN